MFNKGQQVWKSGGMPVKESYSNDETRGSPRKTCTEAGKNQSAINSTELME